jgi:hypothetical protein
MKEPQLERPYLAKGYPWLPALVLILDTALFAALLWAEPASGAYMLLLVAACVPIGLWLRRGSRRNGTGSVIIFGKQVFPLTARSRCGQTASA